MNEKNILNTASIGLSIGFILGMTGSIVPSDTARNILWAIDSCGLILATALLTLYFFRKKHDIVAAGFLIFTTAESVIFLSTSVSLDETIPAFGTGLCLWSLSIAVVSSQKLFPLFVRITGIISALLFAIAAFFIFTGHPVNALTKPLPFFAYPFYAATLAGWAWTLAYRKNKFLSVPK